jgi:hypothetical protein
MQTKWALAGGIMSVVSGVLGIITGLIFLTCGIFLNWLFQSNISSEVFEPFVDVFTLAYLIIYGVLGGGYCLLGILALVGGIYSIRQKLWGLALAGSIASILVFLPLGICSTIFVSMVRPEFLNRDQAKQYNQA